MRLIDADALEIDWLDYTGNAGRDFKIYLEKVPTIEAQPVVHGKWEMDKYGELHCSNCDAIYGACYDLIRVNFCYCCGAKMKEEE